MRVPDFEINVMDDVAVLPNRPQTARRNVARTRLEARRETDMFAGFSQHDNSRMLDSLALESPVHSYKTVGVPIRMLRMKMLQALPEEPPPAFHTQKLANDVNSLSMSASKTDILFAGDMFPIGTVTKGCNESCSQTTEHILVGFCWKRALNRRNGSLFTHWIHPTQKHIKNTSKNHTCVLLIAQAETDKYALEHTQKSNKQKIDALVKTLFDRLTYCNTLQHTASTHCNTLQHTASTHCNTLQQLQHTALFDNVPQKSCTIF